MMRDDLRNPLCIMRTVGTPGAFELPRAEPLHSSLGMGAEPFFSLVQQWTTLRNFANPKRLKLCSACEDTRKLHGDPKIEAHAQVGREVELGAREPLRRHGLVSTPMEVRR